MINKFWAIEENTLEDIKELLSHDHKKEIASDLFTELGQDRNVLNVIDDTAIIAVDGVLTDVPNEFLRYFGVANTAYSEINTAIAKAKNDPNVKKVRYAISSPGGMVYGLFDTLDNMKTLGKPSDSVGEGLVASAAYSIASVAGEMRSKNLSTRFGSVGVVVEGYTSSGQWSITSTGAQNKRPDPKTEAGRAEIVRQLDETQNIFLKYIAEGRGIPQNSIMDKFGNGSVFYAEGALERGMIDKIEKGWVAKQGSYSGFSASFDQKNEKNNSLEPESKEKNVQGIQQSVFLSKSGATAQTKTKEGKAMTLEELKANHPDLVKQIEQNAVAELNGKIKAHAVMAEKTGAYDIAFKAVAAGEGLSEEVKAKYWAVELDKKDIDARKEDKVVLKAGDNAGSDLEKKEDSEKAQEKTVSDQMAKRFGIKLEAK